MLDDIHYSYFEEDKYYLELFEQDLTRGLELWEMVLNKIPTEYFFYKEEHILFFSQFEDNLIISETPYYTREIYPIHYFVYLILSSIISTHKKGQRGFESSRKKYYDIVNKIYFDIKAEKYSFSDILSLKIKIKIE
jgi:hypothetical protein